MSQIYGEPLTIIKFNSNGIDFNKALLDEILLHEKVKDRKVVILAIAGAFRKGKSFFLDYCLRFLYANFKSIKNANHTKINCANNCWMGNQDEPLRGFSWRSGTARETTGIIFWSDVFLYDNPSGEKLAILVVDTQGLFDNETSTADNSKILSLSTLLSSIQILNLHGVVQEDQLQYLQFATEYAKFTSNHDTKQSFKPFQSFLFLVRDWNNPDEYDFGFEGGQKYLDDLLIIKPNHPEESKSVRTYIKSSFDKLSCCLLPYPGKIVARDSNYDGRWSSMDEDFKTELIASISKLLRVENLQTKKINNIEMTGEMISEYFQQFISLYQENSTVQPNSIYEATLSKFMIALVAICFGSYKAFVNKNVSSINDDAAISRVHNSSKEAALTKFNTERKMGTSDDINNYRENLSKKIENDFLEWKAIKLANIMRVKEEKRKAEEAAKEAEQIRLERLENERKAQEKIAQLERENREREAEAARQREILRQQQIAIQAELERQRIAEAERQREIEEQKRIEAERAAEAERARHRKKKKKKCSVM
ncbi:CLUMA_CG000564, isoform A [Clunio marinus]|uniref:CLUMA_CG000564, isoform A n=1 Tax=Clunio marinus TaxID=568069 RepID=A0A1J1HFU8_9DIPT|nr:CLUMA_CG000564, isoform A [Clunio marinus]